MTEDDKLYTNNTGRKSFQWELWPYCNSLCKFCYLGEENRIHTKERQLTSISDLSKAIDTLDYSKYNNISLIGGEFFQGQLNDKETHDAFLDVAKKIFQKYLDKKIGSIWITATLTIGEQEHLYELLDVADKMKVFPKEEYGASGIWICTSWDSSGRFHVPKMKDNWEYHIKNIKKRYPWIKINTTIILQESFLQMYLRNEFVPKKFMEEFSTTLFYKQCGIPNVSVTSEDKESFYDYWLKKKNEFNESIGFEFFPKRSTFVKFLSKYYRDDLDTFNKLFNIKFRADELHRNFNYHEHDDACYRTKGIKQEEVGITQLPCGHIVYYAPYNDSNKCCICDKDIITGEI